LFTQYGSRQRREGGAVVRVAEYRCQSSRDRAEAHCLSIRALQFDAVIEAEVLAALTPHALESLDEAVCEAVREHEALRRTREADLRRADAIVAEAERTYEQTLANQKHAKERLFERWDEALAQRAALRDADRRHPLIPPVGLEANERVDLQHWRTHLPSLCRHPRVSPAQRKRIVRTVRA